MAQALTVTDRKICYEILASLFAYPEQALLDNLSACIDELESLLGVSVPAELKQAIDLTDLEVAYTGLFINSLGGAQAPPYGSVYLDADARLMGESCQRVVKSYSAAGLNLDGSDEPADFLATELEFLYFLTSEEEAVADAGDRQAENDWRNMQSDFFTGLLHCWVPDFCRRIQDGEDVHGFYLWSSVVLQNFCSREQEFLAPESLVSD